MNPEINKIFDEKNERYQHLKARINPAEANIQLHNTLTGIANTVGRVSIIDSYSEFARLFDVENLTDNAPTIVTENKSIIIFDNFNYNKSYLVDLFYEYMDHVKTEAKNKTEGYPEIYQLLRETKMYYCDNTILKHYLNTRNMDIPDSLIESYEDNECYPMLMFIEKPNVIQVMSESKVHVINIFDVKTFISDYASMHRC